MADKQTKIIATIGPATADKGIIASLVEAGVDVFRINFSHGTPEDHAEYLAAIREVEARLRRPVAVMGDLCGPKIRVGPIGDESTFLESGHELTIQRAPIEGTAERISTTFEELVDYVAEGDAILLADGRLRLQVTRCSPPDDFTCRVVVGGKLSSGKGINLPHSEIPISPLTEKDRRDIAWLAERDFDFVALSFVQRAADVRELQELLEAAGTRARIIAKIEKPQALKHIDEIIEAAHGVMVARGDLGVEMDFPAVPIAQKSITRKCEAAGKPCVIATEMLESMIQSPTPTRAEVSDVANAVFDHADAVMLSAESAVGKYPIETVCMMRDTVLAAQDYQEEVRRPSIVPFTQPRTAAAIAGAIRQIMAIQQIAAVVVYTTSGTTARLIAKNRPSCPIIALSAEPGTVRRCSLYYGVVPRRIDQPQDVDQLLDVASAFSKDLGVAKRGDHILVLAGHTFGTLEGTNGLIIDRVD